MKKLAKYALKANLMNIQIRFAGEVFKFNLYEELVINENIINDELKSQPSISGFLGTLLVKLDRIKKDKEAELNKKYNRLFVKYKGKITNSGRPPSDDLAKSMVISNSGYQKLLSEYLQAEENANTIKACSNAFQERSYLIQTLSANIRND